MGRFGPDLQPNDVVATNTDPAFQRRYIEEHAYLPNVLADAMTAAPVGLVYSDHVLAGEDRLKRSRLWNEWMAPQDMYGGIGCKVLESGPSFWIFDVQRGRTQAAFEKADAELLSAVVPHLARAVEISRQFQSTQLLAATFFHLPFGVILVDASMRIKALNTAAEAILLHTESMLLREFRQSYRRRREERGCAATACRAGMQHSRRHHSWRWRRSVVATKAWWPKC